MTLRDFYFLMGGAVIGTIFGGLVTVAIIAVNDVRARVMNRD